MSNNNMFRFRNKRLDNIRKIRQIKDLCERLRVINSARQKKHKKLLHKISDSESVFDENSSVFDDISSVNTDFEYLNEYNNLELLNTIKEEELKEEEVKEEVVLEEEVVVEEEVKEVVEEEEEEANMTSFKQYLNRLNSKK